MLEKLSRTNVVEDKNERRTDSTTYYSLNFGNLRY